MSFQNTTAVTTGLSYFQKMKAAVCKTYFPKSKPEEIVYRNHMKFDIDAFQGALKLKLQSSITTRLLKVYFLV